MPYWTPAEPYTQLIRRDPGRLRIALSHEWGDFQAVPHFVAELERVGRFLEGLGQQVAPISLPDDRTYERYGIGLARIVGQQLGCQSNAMVQVSGNHQLAGKTLIFQIEIESVRPATEEELAHGHVHGPGGHHH